MTDRVREQDACFPWGAIEWAYTTTDTPVTRLANLFAIPLAALRHEIRRRGWMRRTSAATSPSSDLPKTLKARLVNIAGRQIAVIERQMEGERADEKSNSRRLTDIA